MVDKDETLNFSRTIATSPANLYYACTTETGLREWLCWRAQLPSLKERTFSLIFKKKYAVNGSFTDLEENRRAAFSWHGFDDPHPTQVQIDFELQGEQTAVSVTHSGFNDDPAWSKKIENLAQLWEEALDTLKEVMETGHDPRKYNRPMMGIWIGEMISPKRKNSQKLASDYGMLLGGVMKGMGAEAAGMQREDLIVEIDGIKINSYDRVEEALTPHVAGDLVEINYYRGSEKRSAKVKLTTQPSPEIPASAPALAEKVGQIYARVNARLEALFEDVSETQEDFRRAAGEWNSKEALAHLLADERNVYTWIEGLLIGREHFISSVTPPAVLRSLTLRYPKAVVLRQQLHYAQEEGLAFLAELPSEFVARKSSFGRVSTMLLSSVPHHYHEHTNQIERNLAAARDMS